MLPQHQGQSTSKTLEEPPKKVLGIKSLCVKCDKSRGSIYNWLNPKSPQYLPGFPRPIRIGKRAVGWLEDEVDAYLTGLAKSRDENWGVK